MMKPECKNQRALIRIEGEKSEAVVHNEGGKDAIFLLYHLICILKKPCRDEGNVYKRSCGSTGANDDHWIFLLYFVCM